MTTVVIPLRDENRRTAIRQAAYLLRAGKLVAFPTETVYGLGVHLENKKAVEHLYQVKGRPKEKELTLAIATRSDLERHDVVLSSKAGRLMEHFWPGPLTLILRRKNGEKIGVRMPGHPIARSVIEEAAIPIGLPSANPSGQKPPRSSKEVLAYFPNGEIALVLDGGDTEFGVSSTVVDLEGEVWTVVREGVISKEEIQQVCQG